jgi:hypothetical protein
MHYCRFCDRHFDRLSRRQQHEEREHREKLPYCKICGEVFEGRTKLVNHLDNQHAPDPGKFEKIKHERNLETCVKFRRAFYKEREGEQ